MEALDINDISNKQITETDLITRIIAGEKELYEILIRRNNQKLFRVIRSYITDQSEVEDIMQNTYVKAYTKLYQFKHNAAFSTWLIRIGINEALARLKEKGKLISLNDDRKDAAQKIFTLPDHGQLNPQEKMIQKETKQLLENAIDQLDLKYRTVYILKEVEEMSIKEVAESLNISEANVKVRSHRAKKMLKEIIYNSSVSKSVFEFGNSKCDRLTERVMKSI